MDSIIAKPTNRVRVIVAAASGCCGRELNAVATARPSPSAGPILPSAIVRPAVKIEAIAMSVMLSMVPPPVVAVRASLRCVGLLSGLRVGLAVVRGGRDVDGRQNAEDVGLHHAGEQTERAHGDREDERRDG